LVAIWTPIFPGALKERNIESPTKNNVSYHHGNIDKIFYLSAKFPGIRKSYMVFVPKNLAL